MGSRDGDNRKPDGPFRGRLIRSGGWRFFYGWVVLAVAALGIFVSGAGQSHIFSVFIGPIGGDLDLSGASIASAYGFATLAAAMILPRIGRLVDRYGARRVLLGTTGLLGLSCIAFGAVDGLVWLTFGFAALRLLGQGALMLCCANLVSQWFGLRRGFALSLMALGFSVSMAVHPPTSQWLIDLVGWRDAWMWIGFSTWVLLVPPALLLVVDRPEDIGLRPDGIAAGETRDAEPLNTDGSRRPRADFTLRQALSTPTFYIVAAGLFMLSMLVTALHFFQISILASHGLSPHFATLVFPVSAVSMIIAMPLVGYVLDRCRTERVFSAALGVMVVSLTSAALVENTWTAVVYAVVFGLNNAMTMTFMAFMWPRYFGRRHLGSIQGVGQMIGVVGASLGPLPLGLAQDKFGAYDPMLFGLALIPACWAVVVLFLREPVRPET